MREPIAIFIALYDRDSPTLGPFHTEKFLSKVDFATMPRAKCKQEQSCDFRLSKETFERNFLV